MFQKLFKSLNDAEYSLREQLIHRIMIVGMLFILAGMVEVVAFTSTYWTLIPLSILFFVMLIAHMLSNTFQKMEISAKIIGFLTSMFIFPTIFFLSGGIEGGATVWFVFGIFYSIGMFKGKDLIIFTTLSIVVDALTYYVGYTRPEFIIHMETEKEVYADSLFGVILVGVLLGIATKYQINCYDRERRTALKQKEEIEKFSNSKNDFFASMSHEIRTPINTIIGLNEMVLREKDISPEIRENAVMVQNASKMLLSLVNDILDLSQIESKRMEIMPVRYQTSELFMELVEMIRIRMEKKELDFMVDMDPDIPAYLYGDDRRIKQVILNILSNAVKYTKEGSVTFTAHSEKLGEEWCKLIISVADTGIGIKAENLDNLFDSFKRVNNEESRRIEGTGLGLSIAKQLIDLMGGEITVDSIYTKGSVFTITLEQRVESEETMGIIDFLTKEGIQKSSYQQYFEAPEARILIVDDNEMNRVVVEKLLRETKVQLDLAASGEECVEMTKQKYYHVILMDYMMPGINGEEALKQIRHQENGLCREVPVVMLTADPTMNVGKKYLELGFDASLEKPFRGSELEDIILQFLPEEILEYRLNVPTHHTSLAGDTVLVAQKNRLKKIQITADCVCDITQDWEQKYEIKIMYLYINTGKGRFCDRKEIDPDNLSKFLSDSHSNIWAEAASVEDYEKFFAECLVEAEDVIHISLGSGMGKSYANALQASRGFGHVHVVDSGHLSGGMALVVMRAAQILEQGKGVEEICEEIERIKKNIVSNFLMPSSKIFYKNGYTKKTVSAIFELARIHPVLRAKQSILKIHSFQRGSMDTARKRFIRQIFRFYKPSVKDIVYITYAGLSLKEQEELLKELKRICEFDIVILQKCSVTNACFSGLGTIGISYAKDR